MVVPLIALGMLNFFVRDVYKISKVSFQVIGNLPLVKQSGKLLVIPTRKNYIRIQVAASA